MPRPSIPVRCSHLQADPAHVMRECEATTIDPGAANGVMRVVHLCGSCAAQANALLDTLTQAQLTLEASA